LMMHRLANVRYYGSLLLSKMTIYSKVPAQFVFAL